MQDNKLKIWIENGLNNKNNVEVVFIKHEGILNIKKPFNSKFDLINTLTLQNEFNTKFRNSIVTTNKISIFEKLFYNSIKDGFIFIKDYESVQKFIYAIEQKDISKCNAIQFKEVEPIDLEKILKYARDELKEFITNRENILQAMNSKYVKFNDEDLQYFLEVYYKRDILIASFIQKLYSLVNLDFIISEKKKGEILSNILNISSKIVTPKYIGIPRGTKKNANTRVYDLNFNQTELDTKIKIATNLLKLNLKELDIKQISKITDLSINQVEKIYKKIFIK